MATDHDALTDEQQAAFEKAGREIMRGHIEAGATEPLDEIILQGDIDYLDEVAREQGFEDGMPPGHTRFPLPAWAAVFDGVREAWDEHADRSDRGPQEASTRYTEEVKRLFGDSDDAPRILRPEDDEIRIDVDHQHEVFATDQLDEGRLVVAAATDSGYHAWAIEPERLGELADALAELPDDAMEPRESDEGYERVGQLPWDVLDEIAVARTPT